MMIFSEERRKELARNEGKDIEELKEDGRKLTTEYRMLSRELSRKAKVTGADREKLARLEKMLNAKKEAVHNARAKRETRIFGGGTSKVGEETANR